jgi:hypothetical protein
MNKLIAFLLLSFAFQNASLAQNCGSCKTVPKVAHYDYDVQVPQPRDPKEAEAWQQLFWLAKFSQSYLWEQNKSCVHFIDPIAINVKGNQMVKVGNTNPILPLSEPSNRLDYIITGLVRQIGQDYQLHIELQTSCGRKTVVGSDVSFHSSTDPDYIKQIAEQGAARFSSLGEVINDYAQKQRSNDNHTAFSGWGSKAITITPKKYKLGAGEETEIEITLKDCDGTPLANREVRFTEGFVQGFPIKGTTGGTVSPSSVTTDGGGKGKAKFKMGNGKTAFINAHYLFNRPSGCEDAMLGSFPMGAVPVEVEILYDKSEQTITNIDGMLGGLIKSGIDRTLANQRYHAVFYHYSYDPKSGYLVALAPDEELNEEDKKKVGSARSNFEFENGFFSYCHVIPQVMVQNDGQGLKVKEELQHDSVENISANTKSSPHPSISFYLGDPNEPMYFGLSMNFRKAGQAADESLPALGSLSVNKNSIGGTITTTKITDPKSPYKTEYFIEYRNNDLGSLDEVNKLLGKDYKRLEGAINYTGHELLLVRILSPY